MNDKHDKKPQTFNDARRELSEAVYATGAVIYTEYLCICRAVLSKLPGTGKLITRIDELLKK